jgi:hypothetical protein
MPIGVLSRVSNSLSQGGNCVSNLRGFAQSDLAGEPFDYIKPTRRFSFDGALSSISTVGAGDWANTIQKAYYSTDSEGSAAFRYGDFPLTQSISGTLLFRMYLQTFNDPLLIPPVQTVFRNGTDGTDGYGIKLTYDEVGFETFEWNVHFCRLQDASAAWIKLNVSGPLLENTWYQFSVAFSTATEGKAETQIVAYQDGLAQVDAFLSNPIIAPGDTEAPFWLGFYGRLTDMTVINVPLTNTQLAAYGTAPYI